MKSLLSSPSPVPNPSPKFKSQILVLNPNPKSKVQRKGTGTGADKSIPWLGPIDSKSGSILKTKIMGPAGPNLPRYYQNLMDGTIIYIFIQLIHYVTNYYSECVLVDTCPRPG